MQPDIVKCMRHCVFVDYPYQDVSPLDTSHPLAFFLRAGWGGGDHTLTHLTVPHQCAICLFNPQQHLNLVTNLLYLPHLIKGDASKSNSEVDFYARSLEDVSGCMTDQSASSGEIHGT